MNSYKLSIIFTCLAVAHAESNSSPHKTGMATRDLENIRSYQSNLEKRKHSKSKSAVTYYGYAKSAPNAGKKSGTKKSGTKKSGTKNSYGKKSGSGHDVEYGTHVGDYSKPEVAPPVSEYSAYDAVDQTPAAEGENAPPADFVYSSGDILVPTSIIGLYGLLFF